MENTATLPLAGQPLRRVSSLRGPRPWPLVGNLLQIRPLSVHEDVERWCLRYGSYFPVYFGRTQVLVVADHEAVATILRDRPDGFRRPSITARISDEMGGIPGLFMAEGTEWRNQRRMVMQAFAPHAIKAYFPSLVKVAQRLARRWDGAAKEGRTIDLAADLKRYTVDIIAGLAFGTDVNTIDGGEDTIQRYLDDILPAVARRSLSLVPYWRWFKLPGDRRLDRSVAGLRSAVDELIAQSRSRMASDPSRADQPQNLLEAMIAAADQQGSGVDDLAVAGNVSTMLLAGEDTTANTIAWLIWLFNRHPAVLERARAEVMQHADDPASFTIERMDALNYMDACIQEAMRLKPVAPFMPLEALRPASVAGIEVKTGDIVWCVLRHHSVADSHFPRAAEFDPQRWLPDAQGVVVADKKVGAPFGSGPRTCPGRYLALLEIKIAMAMLLGRYDVRSVEAAGNGDVKEVMGFVMSPENLYLKLSKR